MAGSFSEFFRAATGYEPFGCQRRLAGDPTVEGAVLDGPKFLAINVPTGAGKTAAAVLGVVVESIGAFQTRSLTSPDGGE